MNYTILSYLIYIPVTVAVTIWVANTLFNNGRVFLIAIFQGNEQMADSVNKLLIVGFYLINIGYAIYTLTIIGPIPDVQSVIERLSLKLGAIILILGGMHFFNLIAFFMLRNRALER